MSGEFNLSHKKIGSLVEARASGTYRDTAVNGLQMRISPKGTCTWFWRRSCKGCGSDRVTIGRFPDVPTDKARRAAEGFNGKRAQGWSPSLAKAEKAALEASALTLGQAWELFLDNHARPNLKLRTVRMYVDTYQHHLACWSDRQLKDIHRQDVQLLHTELKERGIYAANRTLAVLRLVYNKVFELGFTNVQNPCRGVRSFKETSRERTLSESEVPYLIQAIRDDHNEDAADALMLCLYTGMRKSNVFAMRWDELELDPINPRWNIVDTKNGDPLTVPLVHQAVDILTGRMFRRASEVWVFPSSKGGPTQDVDRAWRRIRVGAGLADLRIHDLRRSVGTFATNQGANFPVVQRMMGHKPQKSNVTMRYARPSLDAVRHELQRVADRFTELADGGLLIESTA